MRLDSGGRREKPNKLIEETGDGLGEKGIDIVVKQLLNLNSITCYTLMQHRHSKILCKIILTHMLLLVKRLGRDKILNSGL